MGRLGIDYDTFWNEMTPVDAIHVAEGVVKKSYDDFDLEITSNRVLTLYIANMMGKNPRDFSEIYALSSERKGKESKRKFALPVKYIYEILKSRVKDGGG